MIELSYKTTTSRGREGIVEYLLKRSVGVNFQDKVCRFWSKFIGIMLSDVNEYFSGRLA